MSSFYEREAERAKRYNPYEKGWKLVTCSACSGSSYYCGGACEGTGKCRENHESLLFWQL